MEMLASIFTDVIRHEGLISWAEVQKTPTYSLHFLLISYFLFSHFPLSLLSCNVLFYVLFPSYYFPCDSFTFFPFLLMFFFPSLPFPLLFPFSFFILVVFPSYPIYLSICFYFSSHLYLYFLRLNFSPLFIVILVFIILFPFLSIHFQELFLSACPDWAIYWNKSCFKDSYVLISCVLVYLFLLQCLFKNMKLSGV
jgi:hypothetical protein